MIACPVCRAPGTESFQTVETRRYRRCETCAATFLVPDQHPTLEEAVAHYGHHRNEVGDPAYRRFLSRLAVPLCQVLAPGASGLDYGCGPGPALADMLEAAGHRMAIYDPIFAPHQEVLEERYDFVTCTEVAEHFYRPADEFDRIGRLLTPGGWFAVMTQFQTDDSQFSRWHYRRDPTHVVFYRADTLREVARQRGWTCLIAGRDVALMQVPVNQSPT